MRRQTPILASAILIAVSLVLAGCDEESFSTENSVHGSADAARLPGRFSDLSPGSAPNCGLEQEADGAIEHCVFRFGPAAEQPSFKDLSRTVKGEELALLNAMVSGRDMELSGWIIVRSRPVGDRSLFYYSVIQSDRLQSAASFEAARTYAFGAKISEVPVGYVGAALSSGQAEWRSRPEDVPHLIFKSRGALEEQLATSISRFVEIRDLDDQSERCTAAKSSYLTINREAQFGCVDPVETEGPGDQTG